MSNVTKIKRKGAGRTKGSFSFVKATIAQMQAANPNPDFPWLLSRKQAESLNMSLTTGSVGELNESMAGTTVETAVKVNAVEL